MPARIKRFIDPKTGSCLVEMTDDNSQIDLDVFVKTFLTMDEKDIRIGLCNNEWVYCEISNGEGEMRALSWEEMEKINEVYGFAIPLS